MQGNQFQNPYSNYYGQPNMINQGPGPGHQGPVQRHDIIQVNGEGGAKAFTMAPNSKALLLDSSDSIVWFKETDGAGYPSLQAYRIEPVAVAEAAEENRVGSNELLEKIEERLTKIEDRIGGIENVWKSDTEE